MPTARRTLALAVLVLAAGSLVFATGAAVLEGPADTGVDDRLAVQPADGPNGNYSYLNDDDEIVVDISAANPNLPPDFEGVNPDALASADGIFTITYTANERAHVWVNNSEGDGSVTFTAGGDSIEGESNGVTLGPDESVAIGLDIDARGAVAGTQLGPDTFSIGAKLAEPDDSLDTSVETDDGTGPSITVSAPGPAEREFAAADVPRDDALRFDADGMELHGTNVTLDRIDLEGVATGSVELTAAGSRGPFDDASALEAPTTPRPMGYLALEYGFDPDAVDGMTVRFSADARFLEEAETDPEAVTLFRQPADGDWEEITVERVDDDVARAIGLPDDRVHFRATTEEFSTFAIAERVPRIEVADAATVETALETGEAATVRATVENGGGADGTRPITLTADGDVVATETASVDAGEAKTVPLTATFETAGEYELAIDDAPAGTLTVGDPATSDGAGGSTAIDDGDTGSDGESASPLTEEPGAIDLASLGGLVALAVLALVGVALVRRMPR